jgi:hypothetical protein
MHRIGWPGSILVAEANLLSVLTFGLLGWNKIGYEMVFECRWVVKM